MSKASEVQGAKTFHVTGETYDAFMGRYSVPLAEAFAEAAGVTQGQRAVDVGCGPGALTTTLVRRLGATSVCACDPAPGFVQECAARCPGVTVLLGAAERIPFGSARFEHCMAQLVLHFVSDPPRAAQEMLRVTRPGGSVAACVWDFAEGMEMLRAFWDAALGLDPEAPDEARTLRFGRPGEIASLFDAAGLVDVVESTLRVASTYESFDDLWSGLLAGVGPAGAYCCTLNADAQRDLHEALLHRLGTPPGSFTLGAVARCAVGRVPD